MLTFILSTTFCFCAAILLLVVSAATATPYNSSYEYAKKQRRGRSDTVPDCQNFPYANKTNAPALLPGMSLGRGQRIASKNAMLILQENTGDLQLIRKRDQKLLWHSNTSGGTRAVFDGQLYVQNDVGAVLWSTPVGGGAILQLQHDCNLVIYGVGPFTKPVWASSTQVCIVAHIVPHSHDDVGWLLTPERYFDGCRSPGGGVSGIIDTCIQMLLQNKTRTYTQVESYFFHRWWVLQNSSFQDTVRSLVKNGQLDLTNGGWSMHDEACVHQESAIANMEVGAQFLKEIFGEDKLKLKIGWHIDPFGHQMTTPRIMAQMGFDAFFFWRQDNQQRQYMLDTKQMENMWRSSDTLGGSYNMLTSIMYNAYCVGCGPGGLGTTCPGGFCCMDCEVMEEEQALRDERDSAGVSDSDAFGSFEAHGTEEQKQHRERLQQNQNQHHHRHNNQRQQQQQQQQHQERLIKAGKAKRVSRRSTNRVGNKLPLLDIFAQHFQNEEYRRAPRTRLEEVDRLVARRSGAAQDYTLGGLADSYAQMVREYAGGGFRTNNVLIPWGCDFRHNFAQEDYPIMDSIIDEINNNEDKYGMRLLYSTPRLYVNALAEFKDDVWPENNKDYYVYADSNHSYWSGYFTSRAEFKGYERWLMAKHRAAETNLVQGVYGKAALAFQPNYEKLYEFRQAMGVAQHHDSITGTERTHVRNRYQMLLNRAYSGAQSVFQDVIASEFSLGDATKAAACPLANLSICAETDALAKGQHVDLLIYNNLAQARSGEVVTIPVPVKGVGAIDFDNKVKLSTQTTPTWRLTTTVDHTSPAPAPAQPYQTYVQLPALSPMSYHRIRLVPDSAAPFVAPSSTFVPSISNEYYKLSFDPATNGVSAVDNLKTKRASPLTQLMAHYCPHDQSSTDGSGQASGAYILRTCQPTEDPIPYVPKGIKIQTQWLVGPLCSEVRQVIDNSSSIQQAWRLCSGMEYVELTNGIGELQTLNTGVEVIQRFSVGGQPPSHPMDTNGVWHTDSEALEMQKRVRNMRPNYPYQVVEFVASNFFPCNTFASIKSATSSGSNMGVTMDRSRAVSSLHDGELEMLIHRRLIWDDGRGVGQALDARTRVLSTSRLVFNVDDDDFMTQIRINSLRQTHYPHWFVAAAAKRKKNDEPWRPTGGLAPVPQSLVPANIHLHALTLLWDRSLLVRLQHLFAANESSQWSRPATVQLGKILPPAIASNPTEYTIVETDMLGLNPLSKMQRHAFKSCRESAEVYTTPPRMSYLDTPKDVTSSVTLRPMELRTFVVKKNN